MEGRGDPCEACKHLLYICDSRIQLFHLYSHALVLHSNEFELKRHLVARGLLLTDHASEIIGSTCTIVECSTEL